MFTMVKYYIPSYDSVVYIFLSGLVVERSLGEPKVPSSNLALLGFFLCILLLLINK